ncbi:T9SS type A sorting domain-containing protein [Hymenobacter sp. HSC-4F20]|uniref:T9SS type A sorting domain-containing protein n=1 Tax=Hymenobacter sp. HSC-4F20 TaxID=2864135 RepID=UPI001C733BE5|nr:T9SS type A sorting domain-containing protein [Hymenobacter sp. HSC-4F20]MBX0289863.1 T9SS type A sorting domain-containing protein [Hymenobacter sp. HSC-4F20]
MLRKLLLPVVGLLGLSRQAQAQTVTNVTEIITDYGGFWQSSAKAISPVLPDDSHDLLSFEVNGTRYSTGVDDALLRSRGLAFTPGDYRALPVAAINSALTSNTKVGVGARFDKVTNGASSPPPANGLATYLRDGRRGLNLGTGAANIPKGTLTFTVNSISTSFVGDQVPDILVTQFADPADARDQYQFTDAQDNVIGNTVTVVFTDIPPVGEWVADFYEASQDPMKLESGFTQTSRPLRLWSADLSTFGITAANAGQIRKFKVLLSGNSDVAFVAYNSEAATVAAPLPVQLTAFSGEATPTRTELHWQTAQELNSAAFEVEASLDGRAFRQVGRVAAAGTSAQTRHYHFQHAVTGTAPRYYRLRQVDEDGSSTYSSVLPLAVQGSAAASAQVTLAPNPFHTSLQLRLAAAGARPTQGRVQLTTLAGRVVYEQDLTAWLRQPGTELPALPTLPAGVYVAKVVLDGQVTYLKLVHE